MAKKRKKSEAQELAALRSEKQARELCESMGFKPSNQQFEVIAAIDSHTDRRMLVKSLMESKKRMFARDILPRRMQTNKKAFAQTLMS